MACCHRRNFYHKTCCHQLQGFIVRDHYDMLNEFYADTSNWISEGKIKWRETVFEGIENDPRLSCLRLREKVLANVSEGWVLIRLTHLKKGIQNIRFILSTACDDILNIKT